VSSAHLGSGTFAFKDVQSCILDSDYCGQSSHGPLPLTTVSGQKLLEYVYLTQFGDSRALTMLIAWLM
jgi:hypothetical protein